MYGSYYERGLAPQPVSNPASLDPLICPLHPAGIMQQFAISEATLFGWNSMDGESIGAGSNHGSVAHLSEVNQESITSRGTADWFELILGGIFHMGSDWTVVYCFHWIRNNLWTVAF